MAENTPWTVSCPAKAYEAYIQDENGINFAVIFGNLASRKEQLRRAHLFAAAPDLIASLQEMLDCRYNEFTDSHHVSDAVRGRAVAAIAKTEKIDAVSPKEEG